jgi:hypothetical protein
MDWRPKAVRRRWGDIVLVTSGGTLNVDNSRELVTLVLDA